MMQEPGEGVRTEAAGKYYQVSRPVYSEDDFGQAHARVRRRHKGILDHVRQYFT